MNFLTFDEKPLTMENAEQQKDDAGRELAFLDKISAKILKRRKIVVDAKNRAKEKIAFEATREPPKLTDHAILRYMERHSKIKVKKYTDDLRYLVASQLDDDILMTEKPRVAWIYTPSGQKMRVVVAQGSIITVI